jgi:hypothetical protein
MQIQCNGLGMGTDGITAPLACVLFFARMKEIEHQFDLLGCRIHQIQLQSE